MAERWNPWRALRARRHLVLEWVELERGGGQLQDHGDHRVVQLDYRLDRIDRNAVLGHELVHDERGIFYCPTTPDALIEKEEHAVNVILAGRLLPPEELAVFVDVLAEFEPVTAQAVAFEFDVPEHIAQRALEHLVEERRAG